MEELVHSLLEQWANFAGSIFPELRASNVWAFLIPLAPACYGIVIKWRNSGYRLLDRLEEFLDDQEKRVNGSREALASLVRCPSPIRSLDEPSILPRTLDRLLWRMNWGYGTAASNALADATKICGEQARLAERHQREHINRELLAHLLLGARAASRHSNDAAARSEWRGKALDHFKKALDLDPDDPEALEFSGLMLLELNQPDLAANTFKSLVALRESNGGAALARAHRLLATAFEKQIPPRNLNAYNALRSALSLMPPGQIIDRALVTEQIANVAEKLGFGAVVPTELQNAWSLYHQMRRDPEGKAGMARIGERIAERNLTGGEGREPDVRPNGTTNQPMQVPEIRPLSVKPNG